MRFVVKDSNLFKLPNNPHMMHLATISYGLREFIVMACIEGNHKGKCYIEEVVLESRDFSKDVWANCKFISDDNLAFDLAKFAEDKGLTDMKKRFNELNEKGKMNWLTKQFDTKI
jgi:hypothetical protein